MDYTTDVKGKQDGIESFVNRSPILIHEPSSSSTRAPGDNVVMSSKTEDAGSTCPPSTDIPPDGQGSNAADSQLLSLLLHRKSPSSAPEQAAYPINSIGTTRETSSHVVDAWQHTRRPRRSFAADFKLKAVAYYRQGNTKAATAKFFGIHRKRIQEWIQQENILRSSPSYKRRMTAVAASGDGEKGEVQSRDRAEDADDSSVPASNVIDESDLSHTGAFTHIQTLTALPLAAVMVGGADTPVPVGSAAGVPITGGVATGKDVTLQNIVSVGASGVPVLTVQPTHTTSSPVPPARATSSPHPSAHTISSPILKARATSLPHPSIHTTPPPIPPARVTPPPIPPARVTPPAIPPVHATSSPLPSAHTAPTPPEHAASSPLPSAHTTPPMHTTPSSTAYDSSELPSSRAAYEGNIAYLRTLTDENVGKLLDAMNLSRYKERFLAEQVDGELLSSLRQSEFRELGIESGLHQLKLLKLVQGVYSAERFLSKTS